MAVHPPGPGLPMPITPTGATQLSTTKFSVPVPFAIANASAPAGTLLPRLMVMGAG